MNSDPESKPDADRTFKRLVCDGPKAWATLDESLRECSFSYEMSETLSGAPQASAQHKRIDGKVFGESFLLKETRVDSDFEFVYCRNESYEFAIRRQAKSPWELEWQGRERGNTTAGGSAYAEFLGLLKLGWCLSDVPLSRLIANSRFSVDTIAETPHGDIELRFNVAPASNDQDSLQGLESGLILLSPSNLWAMRHYTAKYRGDMTCTMHASFSDLGVPHYDQLTLQVEMGANRISRFVIRGIHVASLPADGLGPDEIRLAHYGLPEYHSTAETRRRLWLLLLNIGVIVFLLGLLMRARARRD